MKETQIMKPAKTESEVFITEVTMSQTDFYIVGTSPLLLHAMSSKGKQQLLFPSKKKNSAEKATTMKHDPYNEFLDAAYKFREDDDEPTRLYMPGTAFHSAMSFAAIDIAGAKKAQVGRLTSIVKEKIPVYGVPQIWSSIVRMQDMNRTPDIRFLPIVPKWAATFTVDHVGSLISVASVANLLGAAGVFVGIGDGRPQKGKLAMGKFRVCGPNDPEYLAIVKNGGRAAQDPALKDPARYDNETDQLLDWFNEEVNRRHAQPTQSTKSKNGSKEVHA